MKNNKFEVIVVGGGHAGVEAALACARKGHSTLMLCLDFGTVSMMACNPAIGGTAKGHLVREIDALGGEMALAADKALVQIKMLNSAKGPAVFSLRGQEDKALYQRVVMDALRSAERLTLREGEGAEVLVSGGAACGVKLADGEEIFADAVILATGVYLNGKVIIGEYTKSSGPSGHAPATKLTESLIALGLPVRRFKTGTPARIYRDSIDFSAMEIQLGENTDRFSFMSEAGTFEEEPCWLTYTNARTHEIIMENIRRSPLYNGSISGIGPRYCPSIEDKIMRFRDKERHQIFVEPEGLHSTEMYIQGMSSSLPHDVQEAMYRTVPGLENCRFAKYAYAIEYDCVDPTALLPTLESKAVKNLYLAGQLNGSSGYEEAAAQGLMAGLNASLRLEGKEPLVLARDEAYIGVLIDDLVTKGTNEPYRMMTARAEHRIKLRQDNADMRLTAKGYAAGLVTEERMRRTEKKRKMIEKVLAFSSAPLPRAETEEILAARGEAPSAKPMTFGELAKRPAVRAEDVKKFLAFDCTDEALSAAVVELKYEGYLKKQEQAVKEQRRLESRALPPDIDYDSITALRLEARQKLNRIRPLNLGQASRISGVSPADIAVLIVWLSRARSGGNENG